MSGQLSSLTWFNPSPGQRIMARTNRVNFFTQTGNVFNLSGSSQRIRICALSSTRIAHIDNADTLQAYDYSGSSWSAVGNSISTGANAYGNSICVLSSTRVAVLNNVSFRIYEFDGTNWSTVGNAFTFTQVINSCITALSSTRIVRTIADGSSVIQAYDFDGTNWSAVGSSYDTAFDGSSVPSFLGTLTSSTIVASGANGRLKTFSFNGSAWSEVNSAMPTPNGEQFADISCCVLSSTRLLLGNNGFNWYTFDLINNVWVQSGTKTVSPIVSPNAWSYMGVCALDSTNIAFAMYDSQNTPSNTLRKLTMTAQENIPYVVGESSGIKVLKGNSATPSSFAEQDAANRPTPSAGSYVASSCVIDNLGIIHIVWLNLNGATPAIKYVIFDVAKDKYGTVETIVTDLGSSSQPSGLATCISIDSNNIPHVVYNGPVSNMGNDYNTVYYNNRIGGSWNTAPGLEIKGKTAQVNVQDPKIVIDKDNLPIIIAHTYETPAEELFYGNANDATSFTSVNLGAYSNCELLIDFASNIYVVSHVVNAGAYSCTIQKHCYSKQWAEWEATINNGLSNGHYFSSTALFNLYEFCFIQVTYPDSDLYFQKYTGNYGSGSWSNSQAILTNVSITNVQIHSPGFWVNNHSNGSKRVYNSEALYKKFANYSGITHAWANDATTKSWGQTFKGANTLLKSVEFKLKRTGTVTTNFVAKLYSHSGNFGVNGVGSKLLATSETVNAANIPDTMSWVKFTFTVPYGLESGTNYVIVVEGAGVDSNNYVSISTHANSDYYTEGNGVSYISASWGYSLSYNIAYKLYTVDARDSQQYIDYLYNYTDYTIYVFDVLSASQNRIAIDHEIVPVNDSEAGTNAGDFIKDTQKSVKEASQSESANTASDTTDATIQVNGISASQSEPANTATDSEVVTAIIVASQTDSGSATDSSSNVATILNSQTDSGSATESNTAVETRLADLVDTNSLSDSAQGSLVVPASQTEGTSATSTKDATITQPTSQTEPTNAISTKDALRTRLADLADTNTATSTKDATSIFPVSQTEPTNATDTPTAIETRLADLADTNTAIDTKDASFVFPVSQSDTTNAADSESSVATYPVSQSDSGTGTDSNSNIATIVVSQTDSGSATESNIGGYAVSQTDTGSATESEASVQICLVSQTDTGSATDTTEGAASQIRTASQEEPTNVTESNDAVATYPVSQSDTGSATDTEDSQRFVPAVMAETNALTDTEDSQRFVPVSQTETVSATDSTSVTYIGIVSQSDTASVTETPTAISTRYADISETTSATDSTSNIATIPTSQSDTTSATDTEDGIFVATVERIETTNATESQSNIATILASETETVSAVDDNSGISTRYADITEGASSSDTPTAIETRLADVTEGASATSTKDATRVISASITEDISATDSQSNIATILADKVASTTATDTSNGVRIQQAPYMTLVVPTDTQAKAPRTGYLQFYAVDDQNQDVEYEVQIDTVNTFDSSKTAGATFNLKYIDLYIRKVSNPTDNLTIAVKSGSFGGTTLGTSGTVALSSITTSFAWVRFTFASTISISGNTPYYLVLARSGSSATKYAQWSYDASATYADGVASVYGTSWTDDSGKDCHFRIFDENTVQKIASEANLSTNALNLTGLSANVQLGQSTLGLYTAGPLHDKLSENGDATFTNMITPADTHPFTQNNLMQYVLPSDLAASTLFYWRVRAKDPAGTNAFGAWSSIWSFTTTTGPITASQSEPANTASDTSDATIGIINASQTDSGSATDSQSALQIAVVSETDTASSTESQSVVATFPVSISETGTGTATKDAVITQPASQTETTSATDSEDAIIAITVSQTETVTATDSEDAIQIHIASIVESGMNVDSNTAISTRLASQEETTNATESESVINIAVATITESVSLVEQSSVIYTTLVTELETTNATESQDFVGSLNASQTESTNAAEIDSAISTRFADETEPTTIGETTDASITYGGTIYPVSHEETSNIIDSTDAVKNTSSQIVENSNLVDASENTANILSEIVEEGFILDVPSALFEGLAETNENTTAEDLTNAVANIIVTAEILESIAVIETNRAWIDVLSFIPITGVYKDPTIIGIVREARMKGIFKTESAISGVYKESTAIRDTETNEINILGII